MTGDVDRPSRQIPKPCPACGLEVYSDVTRQTGAVIQSNRLCPNGHASIVKWVVG